MASSFGMRLAIIATYRRVFDAGNLDCRRPAFLEVRRQRLEKSGRELVASAFRVPAGISRLKLHQLSLCGKPTVYAVGGTGVRRPFWTSLMAAAWVAVTEKQREAAKITKLARKVGACAPRKPAFRENCWRGLSLPDAAAWPA